MDNNQPRSMFPRGILFVLAISIVFISIVSFCGGGQSQVEASTSPTEVKTEATGAGRFRMERVGYDSKFEFYRDPVTDVMYLCLSDYNETGLTAMLDPETGLPLTYTRYVGLYKQQITNREQLGE